MSTDIVQKCRIIILIKRIETQTVCTVLEILKGLDVIQFWHLEVISEELLKCVKLYVPKQTPDFFLLFSNK